MTAMKRFGAQILARDGECRCHMCGKMLVYGGDNQNTQACVDHLTPLSMGGENELHNLAFACRSCNSKKGHTKISLHKMLGYPVLLKRFIEVV